MEVKFFKSECIILKRMGYGESDRIITLFTHDFGKVKAIAKGIRKISSKRAPHLEIFTNVQVSFYKGKTFDHITEAQSIKAYDEFRLDLSKASFAYYISELVDYLLPDHQEHGEVYDRMLTSFDVIAASSTIEARHTEIYSFALDILRMLGFLPENQSIPLGSMTTFIESVTERRLKTVKMFTLS